MSLPSRQRGMMRVKWPVPVWLGGPLQRRAFSMGQQHTGSHTFVGIVRFRHSPTLETAATYTTTQHGTLLLSRHHSSTSTTTPATPTTATVPRHKPVSGVTHLVKAGLPLVLFSLLGLWVVSNAYGGKLREMETAQGRGSQSVRQAILQDEHDDMMAKLATIVQRDDDLDNTKRIQRPDEILEERRLARERRNAWHRRWYRYLVGKAATDE